MILKRILFTYILVACCITLNAQQLLPFTENFTKSEYTGDNQVWSIAQGADNALYFANNHYLLRYNGVRWERYSLPNKTIMRSVYADGNRIYTGSYREFGYWERVAGKMEYHSISEKTKLFSGKADNEEIWKIFKVKNTMYFQSFNALYVYKDGVGEKLSVPSLLSYCYVIDGQVYAATVRNGVFQLEGKKFVAVKAWPQLIGKIVHGIEKRGDKIYFFTKNDGIYYGGYEGILPWENPANDMLKDNVLLSSKFIDDERLALGTSLNGLFIINLKDGSYKSLSRQNSLRNNAVLSIVTDKENDLWLGLDNGISHIEVNSPVNIFTDNSGLVGSVYSLSTINNGGYIFVTNHGVFTYNGADIKAEPGSQGQVWDIYKHDNEFVIGHNDGTFVYRNNSLQQVNGVNGGWKFLKSNYDNAYFQANYSGIVVYKDINNLKQWKTLDSIAKPIRNIAQNRAGELWAADNYRSLYRILYDEDFNVGKVENVSQLNGIANDYGVKLFNFRNEILFFIDNSWYNYNRIERRLDKNKVFNQNFLNISDIIPLNTDSFMVIKDGLLYLITQEGEEFRWNLISEKYYQGRLILENTTVFRENSELLVNLDDGFLEFKPAAIDKKEISVFTEAFYMGNLIDEDTHIKYNQSVEVNIVSGYYGYSRPDFFYKFNNGRITPVKQGKITLNNLSSGDQELEIYYNDGKELKKIDTFSFKVAKPWYFSPLMVLVYILVISIISFLYYRWNKMKYTQKIRLNEEELRHRREILELEMEAENRLRKQELEKHILETEVQTKASEVAGKSLSIAKHSEMIEKIQEELNATSEPEKLKSNIKKIIRTNTISKNEWQSFEKNLVKSHEDFVDRLTHKYPALTPKDIKLCIYLKMNLSSKEIAPLMNISYRGVELHRYRLRKKLGIETEESLPHFMLTV